MGSKKRAWPLKTTKKAARKPKKKYISMWQGLIQVIDDNGKMDKMILTGVYPIEADLDKELARVKKKHADGVGMVNLHRYNVRVYE